MLSSASQVEREQPSGSAQRPEWRRELVEAESGLRLGLRADSTFFVDFFAASIIVMTAFILGVSWNGWALLVLAGGAVLATQLLRLGFRALVVQLDLCDKGRTQVLQLATAAVTTIQVAAFTSALIVLAATFQ